MMFQTPSLTLPRIPRITLQRPPLLSLLGCIMLFLVLSLFFVWSRLQVLNLEYGISSLESQLRGSRQEATSLRLEAASLRHPGRIEQVARNELGLKLPDPNQMIIVR